MTPTPQELKELAEFCRWMANSLYNFTGNDRDNLRRISELLAKLAEDKLKE